MSEVPRNNTENSDTFNVLSFERKLVELVEELRLRRNLENENEKTLKALTDEKYRDEIRWDEQQRIHMREVEGLEQQIELLKRKLEDKVCVSDDDKAKQHVMNKTYSQEMKVLKEELRTSKSEKLNLQKQIQELKGKLSLHNNFQDTIVKQMTEIRGKMKSVHQESRELISEQKNVMENVASTKSLLRKFDICNQHLQQVLDITGNENKALKKELISCRSELMLKNSVEIQKEIPKNDKELEKAQQKILNLENLILLSRKENEKTLTNFLESNKVVYKFMDKFSEFQEREKLSAKELEECREKLGKTERKLKETLDEMRRMEEERTEKEKQRTENRRSSGTQTEDVNACYPCSAVTTVSSTPVKVSGAEGSVHISDKISRDFMQELRNSLPGLQQAATFRQSEMCIKRDYESNLLNSISANEGEKKITFSEILKRKIEVMESGDKIEFISMKRRLSENGAGPLLCTINNHNMDNGIMPLSDTTKQLAIASESYTNNAKSGEKFQLSLSQKQGNSSCGDKFQILFGMEQGNFSKEENIQISLDQKYFGTPRPLDILNKKAEKKEK